MHYFEYTPGDKDNVQEENLALMCRSPEEAELIMQKLVTVAIRDFQLAPEELWELCTAEPTDLPIGVMAKIQRKSVLDVLDKETGLLMNASLSSDNSSTRPTYSIYSDTASPGLTNDPEFLLRAQDPRVSRSAFQIQTSGVNDIHAPTLPDHISLGCSADEGNYTPVLTVLNQEHPVRRLIAAVDIPQAA
jgi:hypothetical protein